MIKKLSVGIVSFPYAGNGATSSETPDLREWAVPLAVNASKNEKIERLHIWSLSDTPITMTRNRAVIQARDMKLDVLVFVDSDQKPDMYLGHDPNAKPFFESSFDYIYDHYEKGPVVIGAPYCGPPPHECVYIFKWENRESGHAAPDYQLVMYDRHTAATLAGIQECAALPTGLIMYDMRCFDLIEPKDENSKPFFYYEWTNKYAENKGSTEDVSNTRDISLAGIQLLGYNPVRCNWDAWAGHWKPKCVGKPQIIDAAGVSHKLVDAYKAGFDSKTKMVNLEAPSSIQAFIDKAKAARGATWEEGLMRNPVEVKSCIPNAVLEKVPSVEAVKEMPWSLPPGFDDMGLSTPMHDLEAIRFLARGFRTKYGRKPTVIEVGSWAGASSLAWASESECVHCIDHWAGNKNDDGTLNYDNSRGSPLQVFMKNTKAVGTIHPHVDKSPDALSVFPSKSFDIGYIDAEHDKASFIADYKAMLPKVKHYISGHDVHMDGVREGLAELGVKYETRGTVWWANVG
jgi:hypothetical protein